MTMRGSAPDPEVYRFGFQEGSMLRSVITTDSALSDKLESPLIFKTVRKMGYTSLRMNSI